MHDFNNNLLKKYGKPITELSKTGYGNTLINNDIKMISLDDIAEDFLKSNNEFNEKFSTADALYILKKHDKTQLFFFEFKNINYSNKEDEQLSKFHLNKSIKQMEYCSGGCDIYKDIKKYSKKLVDKSNVSLRSKPSDSLSLFYHIMKKYFQASDDNESERIYIDKLFRFEKFFFLVSTTPKEYIPIKKNKSNRYNNIIGPLAFLKRFAPYHYKNVFAVNENGFYKYFCDWNRDYIK